MCSFDMPEVCVKNKVKELACSHAKASWPYSVDMIKHDQLICLS